MRKGKKFQRFALINEGGGGVPRQPGNRQRRVGESRGGERSEEPTPDLPEAFHRQEIKTSCGVPIKQRTIKANGGTGFPSLANRTVTTDRPGTTTGNEKSRDWKECTGSDWGPPIGKEDGPPLRGLPRRKGRPLQGPIGKGWLPIWEPAAGPSRKAPGGSGLATFSPGTSEGLPPRPGPRRRW